MRLILVYLALAQTRLAMFDYERSRRLGDDAELAYRSAQDRMDQARVLAMRACALRR